MFLYTNQSKKGLSLITVLLFMLVATLAATGVFKWLSTQNKASASRLMQSEVYQASQAGIETARSWMVYHGHDVGALIKQYKETKKPILLDSILRPLASDKNQKFSVLLVGADTKSYPYKLKFISTGTARSGSKYSQVAIVGVDGLYKVSIPIERTGIDFDKAFSGRVTNLVGTDKMQSAIVNGDYNGNVPRIDESLIVTGNANLQGTVDLAGADFYVKGDFSNQGAVTIGSSTSDTNVAYFGGNITDCAGDTLTIHGDAYFNGDVNENCQISVSGNATFNGTLNRNNSGYLFYVGKNLIFTPTGKLNLKASGGMSFTVEQNTISPADVISPRSDFVMTWGNSNSSEIWMNSAATYDIAYKWVGYYGYKNYNIHKGADTLAMFKIKAFGDYKGKTTSPDDLLVAWGVDYSKMNALGNLITAADTVPTPILLKNKAEWMAKEASSLCGVSASFSNNEDNTVNKLNACYADFRDNDPDKLFNGFLVVELTTNANYESSQLLDGKFIFILTGSSAQKLPATEKDAVVMLYLPQGAGDLKPNNPTAYYNYFIYSEGDIAQLIEWNNKSITGSVIMAEGSTLQRSQGGSALQYNGEVLQALADAGIIRSNPDFSDLVIPDSTDVTSVTTGPQDAYYVATSPRLRVQLETQYVNKELDPDTLTSSSYSALDPSILVMPRIIYLTTNAKGTLNQYYSILNLNGANENPSTGSVSCNESGLHTTGSLDGSSGGIYNCTYSPGNNTYNDCPFYVVVEGTKDLKPKVSFEYEYIPLTVGDKATVQLKVTPGSGTITLNVRVLNASGWAFTPSAGVTSKASDLYEVTVTANGTDQLIPIFTEVTGSDNSIIFELAAANGAMIWDPKMSAVYIEGSATVKRESLDMFDQNTLDPNDPNLDSLKKWIEYPDCPSTTDRWIQAISGCTDSVQNDFWTCRVYGSSIELSKAMDVFGCTMFKPIYQKISTPQVDSTYVLHADLKRTPFNLHIKTVGASANVHISDTLGLVDEQDFGVTPGNTQSVVVFHGIKYSIKASAVNAEDHFSYWKCNTASGADCPIPQFTDETYTITPSQDNDTLIIYFNQRDNCFTETFEGLQENCSLSEPERCIDDCISGKSCSVNGGAYTNTADWIMIDANGNKKDIEIEDGSDAYAWNGKNGNQVFILKPIVAGYEGTYTVQIRSYIKSSIMSNQAMNTGLVFRSNADGTSYYSLSILSGKSDNKNLIRVCYATDAHIGSESQCISKGDALSTWTGSNLDQVETYTVKATLLGDSLYVTVLDSKGEIYIPETVFNLKDSKFNASGVSASQNEYVGFKLYGDHFRLYSMTWDSKTYLCFEKPQFYCSFKANYAGGRIPSKTDVTPWAFVSNFCNENEACCDYTYYPSAPMQFDAGNYLEDHVKASASCVRDGETKVFDTIPCGTFFVGDRFSCVEDLWISSAQYCSGYSDCEISLSDTSNLRDAVLNLDVTLNSGVDTINVYFIDANSIQSQMGGYILASGSYSFPVSDFIDVDMFNPEQITKVVFKSVNNQSFEIKNLSTTCPNSLKLNSCFISYDGSELTFTGNASNAQECIISGSYGYSETIPCDGSWTYTKDVDLSSYAGQTLTWDITAKNMLDPSVTESCSDTVMIKAPSGSCSWSPSSLTATTTGTAQFTANFSDCPTGGCAYEIKDHNYSQVATGTGTTGTASFETPADAGTYTYKAFVNGAEVCNATLTVKTGNPPTASCGGVSASGEFTASVTDNDLVGWNYQVVVTDNIGTPFHTSALSATTTGSGNITYSGYNPSVSGTYTYTLKLNGEVKCSSTLTITGSITNCTLTPTTINSGEHVTFSATTNKIADGTSCVIKRPDGTEDPSVSTTINNNSCSAAFYPSQAGVYSVNIGDYNKNCGTVEINVSSSSVVASSSSSGFACNDLNSKTLAKEEVSAYSAGNCFKYTKGATSNLRVGVWSCLSPPSIMNIQKCDGSIVQISHGCNDWVTVPITGSCAIYLQTIGNGGDIKFNDW